jgi:adenosine deaminase
VLHDFKNDGVVYLELRTTPRAIPSSGITKGDYVSIILDCIAKFGRDPMSTYMILSVDRRNSEAEAMEVVDLAIKHQPDGVVGLDLCGDPSRGDISIYRDAFMKAKHHGLKLTLHFAEVPLSSTEKELRTLLSYQPERIGHAIHIHEAIANEIVAQQISLELCISCNVHAKLTTGGFANHHFGFWRNQGCPLILCVSNIVIKTDLSLNSWRPTT